jgi:hypothetical protein
MPLKGNYVDVLDNSKASINNIYKDIIYLVLFINAANRLSKAKGKGLLRAKDIVK